jgi:hypothetical protein
LIEKRKGFAMKAIALAKILVGLVVGACVLGVPLAGVCEEKTDVVSLTVTPLDIGSMKRPVHMTAAITVTNAKELAGTVLCVVWADGTDQTEDACKKNRVRGEFWSMTVEHDYQVCGEFNMEILFFRLGGESVIKRIGQQIVIKKKACQ